MVQLVLLCEILSWLGKAYYCILIVGGSLGYILENTP